MSKLSEKDFKLLSEESKYKLYMGQKIDKGEDVSEHFIYDGNFGLINKYDKRQKMNSNHIGPWDGLNIKHFELVEPKTKSFDIYKACYEGYKANTKKMEESNMEFEEIKKFNKKNLAEAKKQAESEKANEEVRIAKIEYYNLIDSRDRLIRDITVKQEELKEVQKKLNAFESK